MTLVMPDEMSKYIHDFIRAPKRFPAAHHDAFVEGIASLKSFLAKTNQGDHNGREALQYHLWAMLEDTPYSRGEEMLAGWNSMEDTKKAREVREEEEEESDEEETPYCYADGKHSAPIPCGCPQPCCVPEEED